LPLLAVSSPLCAQQREEGPPVEPSPGTGFEVMSGVEFQQFDLGNGQEAEKLSVPVTARLTAGPLRFTAQLPYVRVTAPGNVIVPSGPLGLPILVDPSQPGEVRTREGIGDLRASVAYDLPIPAVRATVHGGAKLPTASAEDGLGTGETDYWVGTDVSANVGAVTPFAGVAYTVVGEPDGLDLRNAFSGQAGAALRLSGSASAHLGYSYAEDTDGISDDEQRIFGGLNTAVGERVSLGFYGSAGVSGPADVGAGISLGLGFR
jgi:hypothetical protein